MYQHLLRREVSYFPSFLIWPLLTTHCKCRGFFKHLIALDNTHSGGRGIGPSQKSLDTHSIRKTAMAPAGFYLAIPSEMSQTYALDSAATGIALGYGCTGLFKYWIVLNSTMVAITCFNITTMNFLILRNSDCFPYQNSP